MASTNTFFVDILFKSIFLVLFFGTIKKYLQDTQTDLCCFIYYRYCLQKCGQQSCCSVYIAPKPPIVGHALWLSLLIAVGTFAAAAAMVVAFFTMQIEQFALLSHKRDLHA